MKKIIIKISCFFICLFSIVFISCSSSPDLYNNGIEITTIMGEMVKSEDYTDLIGVSDFFSDYVPIAYDYDTPVRTYSLTMPNLEQMIDAHNLDREQFDKLSDVLKTQITNKIGFSGVINSINSLNNVYYPALSSVYTANLQFNGTIESPIAYLYIFETGTPIIVIFTPNGTKQFTATGYFLFSDQCTSLSGVRDLFEPFGCKVENVN